MSTKAPARSAEQRKHDTLQRLEQDVDVWVATSDAQSGDPYLIPLSFYWDGTDLWLGTLINSLTSRNVQASSKVRLGLGVTRDVIMIDAIATMVASGDLPADIGDAFAEHAGFDPRKFEGYCYFRVTPQRMQAWRESNEIKGRDLMLDGEWLVS